MDNKQLPKNSSKTGLIVCLILSFLGGISFVFPIIIGETFKYAPFILVGILFMISFGIVSIYMNKAVKAFDKLMLGEDVIAYWELDEAVKEALIKEEYAERTEKNRALLTIVGIFCGIFGIMFLVIDVESGIFVALILGFTWLLCLLFAIMVPKVLARNTNKNYGEVYISKYSVYINGRFHYWNMFGRKLKSVSYNNSKQLIEIRYIYLTRTGYMTEVILIPVANDRIAQVEGIIKKILA